MTTQYEEIHYFASCVFGWATAATREGAILKLVKSFQRDVADAIKRCRKVGDLGMYAWTCQIDGPEGMSYDIEYFQPQGVTITGRVTHSIIRATLSGCDWVDSRPEVYSESYA